MTPHPSAPVEIQGVRYIPMSRLVTTDLSSDEYQQRMSASTAMGAILQNTDVRRGVPFVLNGYANITFLVPEHQLQNFQAIWDPVPRSDPPLSPELREALHDQRATAMIRLMIGFLIPALAIIIASRVSDHPITARVGWIQIVLIATFLIGMGLMLSGMSKLIRLRVQSQGPRPSEPYISVITWTNSDKRTVIDGGKTQDEATRRAATFRTPEFRTVKIFCRHLNWGVEWKRSEENTWTEVGSAIEPGPR